MSGPPNAGLEFPLQEFRAAAKTESLADLNRERLLTRINLRGLSRREVADYVRTTVQLEPPPALVDLVHEKTQGRALPLSEVINLMAQDGLLEAASISDIAIPEGMRKRLGLRHHRLTLEANDPLSPALSWDGFGHAQLVDVSLASRMKTSAPDIPGGRRPARALRGSVTRGGAPP